MTFKHQARRPSSVWIVVADRARARLFTAQWPSLEKLCEIDTLIHPEGEMHQRDVESDGPGRFFEAQGPKHAAEPRSDFKHRTALEFARELVTRLQKGKDAGEFGYLVVIASPLFLGMLRDQLPAPLRQLVVADLDKEMTHLGPDAILDELTRVILSGAAS